MARLVYDIEVIVQGQGNPICWVAACAMVKDYALGVSRGVAQFTDGLDPANSSIPSLGTGAWPSVVQRMHDWGFKTYAVADFCAGAMGPASSIRR